MWIYPALKGKNNISKLGNKQVPFVSPHIMRSLKRIHNNCLKFVLLTCILSFPSVNFIKNMKCLILLQSA